MQNEENSLKTKEKMIVQKKPYFDEPKVYQTIGLVGFATSYFIFAVYIFNGFQNKFILTIWGFFIGGLTNLISGLYCFKYNYYIDGACHLFFSLNWGIMSILDLFLWLKWMEPFTSKEYGFYYLMCCFFSFLFFLQYIYDKSKINTILYAFHFFGYLFCCIGSFNEKEGIIKTGAICFFINAFFGYYKGFAIDVNTKYKRLILPFLDEDWLKYF